MSNFKYRLNRKIRIIFQVIEQTDRLLTAQERYYKSTEKEHSKRGLKTTRLYQMLSSKGRLDLFAKRQCQKLLLRISEKLSLRSLIDYQSLNLSVSLVVAA